MTVPGKTRLDGVYRQTKATVLSEYAYHPVRFFSILAALVVGLGVLAFFGPISAQIDKAVNPDNTSQIKTVETTNTDSQFLSVAEIANRSSQPNEYFKGDYEVVSTEDAIKVDKPNIEPSQTEVKLVKEVGAEDRTKDISVSTADDAFSIESKDQGLTAGAYKVETIQKDSGTVLNDQKVLWGVLAFNPDYAVYPVGKDAFFSLAVLDDRGKMVCTAAMTVEVTAPDGKITTLSTADGTVRVNKDCEVYGKTDRPDYEANFKPSVEGDYKVKIIAKVGEGSRTLHDQFSVKADQDFYLQRVGVTRTYPPIDYDYTLNFEAKKAGQYTLTEKVPSSFEIKNTNKNCQSENSLRGSEQPATLKIENCKLKIVENGNQKLLTWDFSIAADQAIKLAYAFKTPNISPFLFELGPAEIENSSIENSLKIENSKMSSIEPTRSSGVENSTKWIEPRSWLIASDNACQSTGTGNWNTAGTWTSCGSTVPQTTDTVTILNTHVVTMDASPTVIDVTINNGGTLTVGTCGGVACSLTVSGNWSNSGTFTASTGTVTFSSTATGKTLAGTMTGATGKFYNIVFNGVGGGWTLSAALEAANNFNITNGSFDTNGTSSYALTVTGTVTVANTAGVGFLYRGSTITVSGSWSDVGQKANTSGANQVIMNGTGTITNGYFCKLSIAYTGFTTTLSSYQTLACSSGNTPLLTFNGGTATSASSYTEIYNDVTNTPISFAAATTLTGTRQLASYANAAAITVSIPAGDYGSWNLYAFHTSGNGSTTQLSGNVTTTGYFIPVAANAVTGSIFNTGNFSLTASYFQLGDTASRVGAMTANFGSSTVSLSSTTDSLLPTATGTTAYALNLQTSSVTVYGNTKFINSSSTITLNAGTSTVTYAAVATGKTITSNSQSFYNLIFNGSGGGWTPQDAMLATNDLTMTAGTLSGTQNITINGAVAGTAGIINLTGGTFTQSVAAAKNFGTTSGSTAWTFSNLTFTASPAATITTQTGGTGDITVAGVLNISTSTTFDAGNRTYHLTGSGTPLSKTGTFTPNTSTISYENTTSATITGACQTSTYYNLQTSPASGTPTYTMQNGSTSFLAGTKVLMKDGTKDIEAIIEGDIVKSYDPENNKIVLSKVTGTIVGDKDGYYIINGKVKATGNHVFFLADHSQKEAQNLRVGDVLATYAGSETITNIQKIDTSVKVYDIEVETYHTFYAENYLVHNPSCFTVSNNFTLTGAGSAIVNAETSDPAITVTGNFTIGANQTFQASSTQSFSIAGNYSNSGTFTANSSTVNFAATDTGNTIQGTLSGSTGKFYKLTFNGSGGEWTPNAAVEVASDLTMTDGSLLGTQDVTVNGAVAGTAGIINLTGGTFEQRVGAAKNFGTTSGSTAWTFYDLTFSNSHASSPFTVTTQTGGTGGITVSDILRIGKSGDAAGATTTLNAGNRIWTLSGTGGDPFQLLASPLGVLTGATSTFKYTGNNAGGNTTIQSTSGSYNNLEINDGLQGYWKMDETTTTAGATVMDVSGNANTGTPNGTGGTNNLPQPSTDVPSVNYYGGSGSDPRSLNFDGSDDYVDINSVNPFNSNFTVQAWVKFGTVNKGTDNAIVGHGTATTNNGLHLAERSGKLYFGFYGNDLAGATTLLAGTWYHVAFVYDGGKKIYLNGALDNSGASNVYQSTSSNARIGGYPWSSSHDMLGNIDDVRIYNRAIGTGEITSLAAGNHPTYETYVLEADTTVTNNLGVRTGALDVTASNYALTVGGNLTNVSNFSPNSGTVTMNSTASGKTIQSDPAFYKLKFHNASGGGGWTSQNRLLVDTTSGTPAADALVIGNGTVTIGDGDDDNLLVYGGIDIGVNANETGTLQTMDGLAEGSTITLQVNKDTSTQCANCIVDVGASSGSGQGTLTINENGILKLIPKSSATASDTGVEVASTGKLNVTGALSLAATTSTAITDYDNRETKICANADFSAGYTSKHVRATSGLAIGQIYAITATTADDAQCDTGTHDSITRVDTSTASVVSASKTLSLNNTIMSVCIPDSITANDQKLGSYMRDFTGTKGYFQVVDSANDSASCTGTDDLLKVIESPDVFSGFTSGDTVDISDGVRPGDNFEIYDYANVTAEDGVACTATANEAGESYIYAIAGSETVMNYADVCNLGRAASNKYGVTFSTVNGTNASEGVTIDRSRLRNGYDGAYMYATTNNNTANAKGITNSSATGNADYGFRLITGANSNTLTSNTASNNTLYGIRLDSSNSNTLTSNIANNNTQRGINLTTSSNNTLTSNTVVGNITKGVLLESNSYNNTLSSNTAIANVDVGIQIINTYNSTLTSNSAIANSSDGFILVSASNNYLSSNSSSSNTDEGYFIYLSSNNNTFKSNTATNNTAYGFRLYDGSNNNILTGNQSGGQQRGLVLGGTISTGNVVINDVYGTSPNTTADIEFGTGAHTLSLYNTTLSSSTEVTGVTVAGAYIVSRKHDGVAGTTKIWGEYAVPADTAETPQDEDTDKFNYANNLWEKSVTPHRYSGTGTEDTNLSYDLSAPADLSAGPYAYKLVTKTAGVGASCVTSQAVMDVYRNGTDVGDLTTGTLFTDSTGAVNTKFTVDCGATPYALNATYTFTAYDADNSTSAQKTMTMMTDGDIFTASSGKTLEMKGQTTSTNLTTVTRGATGGYHFNVAGTIDAQYYKFSYLGGTGGGTGLDLQSGATITNLDDGEFDNFQNVGATDTYITVHGSLIGSGAPAKTWDNMTFLEASDNVPEYSVTQTVTGAPAAGNYWSFFGSTCTGWTDCEASDSDTGDGGTDTYGFLHFSSSISVQGIVYLTNESTIATSGNGGPCDGSTAVITARVDGGSAATATCSASTAAYTVYLAITPTAGQTVTIYLTSASKGNAVTLSNAATETGVDIYVDQVAVRHDNAGPQTNTGLDLYDIDQNATDMLFTVTAGALSLTAGKALHITTGKTFTPGGTVTTGLAGDLHIVGTLSMGGNALSIGGSYNNAGTFTSASNTTTFTSTATGKTLAGTMTGASSFYNLVFDGVAGGWTYSNAVAATNDFTVTNGAVTANNLALTVTRDFTLANTVGVGYTAGSSTITVSRHWNDSGAKYVYNTSTAIMNGTGTQTGGVSFYNFSIAYTGYVTTLSASGITVQNVMTVNGGTGTATGNVIYINTSTSNTPFVFAAPTTLNGSLSALSFQQNAATLTVTVGGNFGTWTPFFQQFHSSAGIYQLGSDFSTTVTTRIDAVATGSLTFTTTASNYGFTVFALVLGYPSSGRTGAVTLNLNGSTVISNSYLQVDSNGGSHTLNLGTSTVSIGTNWANVNGTGTIAVTPGTSTVTFNATATGKTITSNAQSFYNLVFNGVGGGWTFQDATIATNDFTVTNGAVTANNLALTVTRDFTLANTAGVSYTAGSSTVTVSRHWNDAGMKYVIGTSTLALNGTGTFSPGSGADFYNLSVAYSGFTTSFAACAWIEPQNVMTVNGGTLTMPGTCGSIDLEPSTSNTPFVFAAPTTMNGGGSNILKWRSRAGGGAGGTTTVAAGDYGSFALTMQADYSNITFNQAGNVTTTARLLFATNGLTKTGMVYNTQNFDLTVSYTMIGAGAASGVMQVNFGSSNITFSSTTSSINQTSGGGNQNLDLGSSNISAKGDVLFVNGTSTITVTPGTSTLTWTHTSGTKTYAPNGQSLYNMTLNGSGGTVTPSGAVIVTNDLTMTAGTLSGTQNVTVNGTVAGTAGIITLTGGTFTQRVGTDKNFGTTSGSTAWTFSSLTFSNSCTGLCVTNINIFTQAGTGGITVSGTLLVGAGGDSYETILSAGNRTWTLSGTTGDPFQLLASPVATLTAATSTFSYTGANAGGNTTVQSATYYNLIINAADTFVLEATTATSNDLTITHASAILDVTAAPYALTVGGNYSNSGTFTARTGTVTFNATDSGNTLAGTMTGTSAFYILTFNGVSGAWSFGADSAAVSNNFTITNGTITAPSTTLTIGGNYANSGTFTANSGTVTLDGSAAQALSGAMTTTSAFYDLTISNASGTIASDCERTDWVAGVDFNAAATVTNNYTITTASVKVEYESGAAYTINNMNWNGQAVGTRLYFRNSATSGTWLLNVTAIGNAQTKVSYINVSRSDASGGALIIASDGTNTDCGNNTNWQFDETLTLSLDSTSKDFGTILPGANPSDQTSTLTATSNAVNGYVIYGWSTQAMTNVRFGGVTIADWTGTNATPTTFSAGSYGFGYSTDDSTLTGGTADRFTNGGAKFAGFGHSGPGDPVADRTAPATAAVNTVTYRLYPSTTQANGDYTTVVVYVITAQFP